MLWDASHCQQNITLDGSTAENSSSRWSNVLASEWVSEGVHEITLDCDCVDNLSLFVGVVSKVGAPAAGRAPLLS
jgi:hypothetical protein